MTSKVPAAWPDTLPCKIAFVGAAPSNEEVLKRRVFVGPTGRVFDQLLAVADLRREDYLITNVFDFQVPNDEVTNLCAPTRERQTWQGYDLPSLDGKGAYLRPEFLPSLARLQDELERAAPTVIVPMGATALWALTGSGNTSSARGSVTTASRLLPGTKIVPTLSPTQVLQKWQWFGVVVSDFIKAERESAFPEVRLPRRELWLDPTAEDLLTFKREFIDGCDLLSVDIETKPKFRTMTCIGFAPDDTHALTVPFWDMRRPSHSYWRTVEAEELAWEYVRELCESDTPKLFQNGPYDIYWLWDRYGIKVRNYRHDTRLIHHALYPELPKSLEFMGATYGNQGPWKLLRPGRDEKRDA